MLTFWVPISQVVSLAIDVLVGRCNRPNSRTERMEEIFRLGAMSQPSLNTTADWLRNALQVDYAILFVPDESGSFLIRAASGLPRFHVGTTRVHGGDGSTTAVTFHHQWVLVFDDLTRTSRFAQ